MKFELVKSSRLASGACAGVVSQTLIYPLEITKTRLAIATKGEYSGIRQCLTSILRNEGPLALFKGKSHQTVSHTAGLTPSLCGIVPYAGVDLTVFSMLKEKYISMYPDVPPGTLALLGNTMSG